MSYRIEYNCPSSVQYYVDKDRLLMTNILPLTLRREYTDIVLFWKCLYGRYDTYVDVHEFAPLVTRMILASFLVPPLCRIDCFKRVFSY